MQTLSHRAMRLDCAPASMTADERASELITGRRYDAVVELGVNAWNGNREIQLKLVDIKESGK